MHTSLKIGGLAAGLIHTVTAVLESNRFVVVLALDFSKAFDSVRHSAVIGKFSLLHTPNHMDRCVLPEPLALYQHGNLISQLRTISASIIQGSPIGPASYVVTASDLRPVSPNNFISKYADDTYLIIYRLIISIHAWPRSITLKHGHSTTI